MNNLHIILNLYKEDKITKEEATSLIENMYYNRTSIYPIIQPYYSPYWWNNNEVTCTNSNYQNG